MSNANIIDLNTPLAGKAGTVSRHDPPEQRGRTIDGRNRLSRVDRQKSFQRAVNELHEQIEVLLKNDPNRETVLEQVLHVALAQFRSETGTIHLLDDEKQTLFLAAQVGLPPQMLEVVKTIPVGKGIAGQVIAQNKPVTICNLQTDSSGIAKPGAKQTGVGGALCVPLRDSDKTVGTPASAIRQHEFTPDETRELEEIGRLIGRFLKL